MSTISGSFQPVDSAQVSLERQIQAIQGMNDSSICRIPEDRIQTIVARVAQSVFPQVVDCLSVKEAQRLPSFSMTAASLIADKEYKEGIEVLSRTQGVIQMLKTTLFGRVLLLRVVHDVTRDVLCRPSVRNFDVCDIQGATVQFAAQPLMRALKEENLVPDAVLIETE